MFQTRHVDDGARPADRLVWTNHIDGRDSRTIQPHEHSVHEVLWGATGTRTVEIGDDTWIIPPTIGVVIPAWVPHGGDVAANTSYRCTFIDPSITGAHFDRPVAIAITPAWRELVLRLGDDLDSSRRRRVEHALVDLTEPVDSHSVVLPLPRDERLRRIAQHLIAHPADTDDLISWGRRTGASARTITRRFTAETGFTFAEWRTHARIRSALVHLANGHPVAHVAQLVGYQTSSAFVRAFRHTTGQTPGTYAVGTSSHAYRLDNIGPTPESDTSASTGNDPLTGTSPAPPRAARQR